MRFGLQIPNFTMGAPGALFEGVVDMATVAEDSGYDSVWVMDHFYQLPPMGGPAQPMLDSYTLLGALAARTNRVRLGTMVTGVTYRNPAHLAKIVTTLDVISAGRAILGIGAAWYDVEHEGLGFDFPPAGERLDRLEEALQICRAMFTEESPSFEGTYYRIRDARNVPPPAQPGGPKILVGGGGEKRTLKLVARYADMCNFFGDAATFRHKVDVLRDHCAGVGRDPSEVTVSRLSTLVLTGSAEETAATKDFIRQVGADPSGSDVGTADELVARVEELGAAGVEYFVFNIPTGTADTVREVGKILVDRFSD
jgi:F420-dependent oxidoreductase-like protein